MPKFFGVLDHIAGDNRISFDRNTLIPQMIIITIRRWRVDIADEIARNNRQPPALQEVGDGNAPCAAVNDIGGNHSAIELEFRVNRCFAGTKAGISGNLDIISGIGADGRKGTVGDLVVGDHDICRPEHIDTIAPLARAAIGSANASKSGCPITMVPSSPFSQR